MAEREAWRLTKREPDPAYPLTEADSLSLNARTTRDAVPVTNQCLDESRTPNEVQHSLKVLDRTIRKARDNIRGLDATEGNYQFTLAGITFLQEFRRSLAGSYYSMRLPTVHYSQDKVRSIAN